MLIKPDLKDEEIITCLRDAYGLTVEKIAFLPLGGSAEFQSLLKENGFVVLAQTDIHGEAFSKETSERILTVARKV